MGGTTPTDFGTLLKRYRQRVGLTQRELAARAQVSVATIRDLEQGRSRSPRARSVRVLAVTLGLSPAELASLRHATPPPTPPRKGTAATAGRAGGTTGPYLGILGRLVLRVGGVDAPLPAGQHRTLLGRLALTPNAPVHRGELTDLLWGPQVPATAVNLLQTHVSRLRRTLEPHRRAPGPPEILTLAPGGYQLNVSEAQLDLLRFRRLVARSHTAAEPELAFGLLDQALAIWRDAPVTDIDDLRDSPQVAALVEDQICAAIRHAELAERLGRHAQALTRLRDLALRHPLHEPLHARLVTALAATGRQAAALAAYQEIRQRLAEELGLDPGAELADAYQGVLRQRWTSPSAPPDRSRTPAPFQAPAPPADFTGRQAHLAQIIRTLRPNPGPAARADTAPAMPVCAVSGIAGVGKTTLALRAAQLLRDAYPDGQLHVDLRGHGDRPVTPLEALGRFLRALGVAGREIPVDEPECAALYRSVLTDRRVLVVLDNAREAAQVRPLLPGPGGCAALVTSRRRLPDLAGATMVDLGPLTGEEAVDLLRALAGPTRVAAEPQAAVDLAAACGRLPLALRVAGGRLAGRPGWTVGRMVERLEDRRHRLEELTLGDIAVGPSFDLSYRDLPPRAARVFRVLACLPVPDVTVPTAAAVLDLPESDVEDDLALLTDTSLMRLGSDGRFGYHDLVRLYAVRRADTDDHPSVPSAAFGRLLDWYLAGTAAAMRLVYPEMLRLPSPPPCPGPDFADDTAALAWLDAELTGLVPAVEYAAHHGPRHRAWQIADQLRGYFFVRRDAVPWITTSRAGLAAATADRDLTAEAAVRQSLGQAYWSVGRHAEALDEYRTAASAAERGDWLVGLAYLLHNIGLVQAELGRLPEAEASYRQALDISTEHAFDHVRAVTLNDLGAMCHDRGQLSEAAHYFSEAMTVNESRSHRKSATVNRCNLGMVLRQLGNCEAARGHLEAALDAFRRDGSEHGQMAVLDELSQLHTQTGRHPEAVAAARKGLDLSRAVRDRRGEAALLTTLGEALIAAGSVTEARCRLEDARRLASENSYRYFEIRAGVGLARAYLASGAHRTAAEYARAELSAARAGGYAALEAGAEAVLREARAGDRRQTAVAASTRYDAGE